MDTEQSVMPSAAVRSFVQLPLLDEIVQSSRLKPGAWIPNLYPKKATHQGSLNVVQSVTKSPKASKHTSAYRTKASMVSLWSHPPRSWRAWGRSQWYKVTMGRIPASRRAVRSLR